MLDLSNPDDLARAYGQPLPSTGAPDPAYTARASVSATLAGLMSNPNEGYRYTRHYFDLGGEVFTAPIQGNQILADSEDDAEAFNWVGFFDLSWQGNNGTSWQSKTLFDILETSKLSSYGYAIDTQQWVLANNLQATRYLDFAIRSTLSYGLGLRYTFSEMVQDYFAEPFSRRDVSLPTVTANSRVLTGGQVGPDGLNYWSPDIGANVRSHLTQTAFFGQFDSQLSDRIRVMLSARVEQAWYQTAMPTRVQRVSNAQRVQLDQDGDTFLYSLGASFTYALSPDVNLYLAAQDGIALDLTQAGGVYGEENFASADLLEAGIKVNFMGGRIQSNLSVWEWNQSRFNERDFQSEPLAGKGVEFEATLQLIPDSLFLMLSAENQRLRRKTGLGFRTLPRSEIDWALEAGVMNGGVDPYPENNPELNYPGFPENTYKAHLIWKPAPFQFALSAVRSRAYWLNFEQTLKLPSSLLVSAYAQWTSGPWAVAINVENLTNETHFLGADPLFSSNTLVTKGEPRRYGLTLSVEF
jgi:iron complex outermembrane recepter protein